ncbi:MAG: hypothetical protein HQK63_06005 [Desulfamplus sp.]|nr:hypothetical protein [Desulfamplus sp.]
MSGILIDTNILVYAYDVSEINKYPIAKELIVNIWKNGGGVLCVQNLMEFFVVITRKVKSPIPIKIARTIIDDISKSDSWSIIDRDIHTFLDAINIVSEYNLHI